MNNRNYQEVRFSDTSPTLKLGPADIRLEGYVALAGLFDSANVGGSIGTNFAAIPYKNTSEGNATEFRLSSQRTRVAVRVDAKPKNAELTAYLEADFRGTRSRARLPSPALVLASACVRHLAGLVWDRAPAVRFAYRPNRKSLFPKRNHERERRSHPPTTRAHNRGVWKIF